MKTLLAFLALTLLCGCYTRRPLEGDERALRAALGTPRTVAQPPITITTKFAGSCPYCGTINLSITCTPSGVTASATPGGGGVQTWTIDFRCRQCFMSFTDRRDQFIPPVRTVRLPLPLPPPSPPE